LKYQEYLGISEFFVGFSGVCIKKFSDVFEITKFFKNYQEFWAGAD
jgi:hypothetical protein